MGRGQVDWALVLGAAQLAVLLLLAVVMLIALRRLGQAGQGAKRAAVAARRAAQASDRRARQAEQALIDAQRPWVTVEALSLTRPDVWVEGKLDARAELALRNTGLTPARNLTVRLEPAASPDGLFADGPQIARFFDAGFASGPVKDGGYQTPRGGETVVPGQGLSHAVRLASPEVGLKQIVPGGLFVVGRLDYEDASGCPHFTRFVFQLANRDGAWRFDARPALGEVD
jgi:hypothetical protein